MKEQFVPYEIALKLKEKGFKQPKSEVEISINHYYSNKGVISSYQYFSMNDVEKFNKNLDWTIYAPLWQQVIDWLESKHGVVINVTTFIRREDGKPHIKMFYVHKHPLVPKTFECEVSNTIKTKSEVIEHALTLI